MSLANFVRYGPASSDPIQRIIVDYFGSTDPQMMRIGWIIRKNFADAGPYTFTIEINPDLNDPESWQLAATVTDVLYADIQRITLTGKNIRAGARIIMTTATGTYTSYAVPLLGKLSQRQYNLMKTIVRRHTIHARNMIAFPGMLLKRKWFGVPCRCRDTISAEITDTYCLQCYGTGFVGGYWKAWEGRLIDISPSLIAPRRDPQLIRGTSDTQMINALLASPIPADVEDIWVRYDTNKRYYIRYTRVRAEVSGIPVAQLLEMGPADFADVIYQIPVP